ncbi:MAG: sigma-54-dependent Fis family transcriptional regulator [Bacteroidales bacterium]|nr:sigma-54-dependent Fis family transcriptional regulator [Bacteroidales bacterium]
MKKLLIVDSEPATKSSLKEVLEYESYHVDTEDNYQAAFEKICKNDYFAVLSEIKFPKTEGISLLQKVREQSFEVPFIMMIRELDLDTVVRAMKCGASHVVQKPINLNTLLSSLREIGSIKSEPHKEESNKKRIVLEDFYTTPIIGNSKAMQNVFKMIEKVAPTNERVLIVGPNGTGKELIARRIHECSKRRNKAFIAVNCAAIPAELIESQLFGHEKGSFTSAVKMHKGDFEQANGGTLFLDEIGDMSLSAQSKILRVLQEKQITRVGGESAIPIDVRVIAATNKDLHREIHEGRFREDLYHRLSVIPIKMPSLSERREDIPLLIEHFMAKMEANNEDRKITIGQDAIDALQELPWTGNVRELENSIERLWVLCNDVITKDDVEEYVKC